MIVMSNKKEKIFEERKKKNSLMKYLWNIYEKPKKADSGEIDKDTWNSKSLLDRKKS